MVTRRILLISALAWGCIGGPPAAEPDAERSDQGEARDVSSDGRNPNDGGDAALDAGPSRDAVTTDVRPDLSGRTCCSDAPPVYRIDYDPRSTYLMPMDDDVEALDVPAVSLAEVGVCPGDRVRLMVEGGLSYDGSSEEISGAHAATFSGSDVLLDRSHPDRVRDATNTADGEPVMTLADVSHDFSIPGWTTVTVPDKATHLFVTVNDGFFGDNADEDDDLRIAIGCE